MHDACAAKMNAIFEVLPSTPPCTCMCMQASPILRDFAARWQHSIEGMHQEVTKQFADLDCGRDVLQVGATGAGSLLPMLLKLLPSQVKSQACASEEWVIGSKERPCICP